MGASHLKTAWVMVIATLRRFQTAIEAVLIGLLLGLIDVHSKAGDWFEVEPAYFIAGSLLGIRHARQAWQAWIPLGLSLYLIHLAAIAHGYRQPYVEDDAASAAVNLDVAWAAGLGLALGVLVRVTLTWFIQVAHVLRRRMNGQRLNSANARRTQDVGSARISSEHSTAASTGRIPGRRTTVSRLMFNIVVLGIHLAFVRALIVGNPLFGFGTIYSELYSESRFKTLRVGMSREEVESIVGPPLRTVAWNKLAVPQDEVMWYYSDQPHETASFWRRWVLFRNGKVANIINDFWVD